MKEKIFRPDRVADYFRTEWKVLLTVTISGLIYNIGLLANPWFEGHLAGCLVNILSGKATIDAMGKLVILYLIIVVIVQGARYIKRFYVRRFSNNINRRMKRILYHNLLLKSKTELENEGVGNVITKAISDVDDCAEGMRKFTTEVFDTGVALAGYIAMLLWYDWKLALLTLIFPPISYFLAEKMKYMVQQTGARFKEKSGQLSADTLDRVTNAMTYRIFGNESRRNELYEESLEAYEQAAVRSNIWISALPPLYHVISMLGTIFIFYFGAKNIMGKGWCHWDIAIFTTFLSCYTKMSVKSAKAAKLFNAVHKAQVSWKRIKPYMHEYEAAPAVEKMAPQNLSVRALGFTYPSGEQIFSNLSFEAEPGQIIGITGPVACGKSTLGRVFLCEQPYEGSIRYGEQELSGLSQQKQCGIVGYMGHETELFNDSIINNIILGDKTEITDYLKQVCFDEEISQMKDGVDTVVGNGGIRLSGGQAQRVALARVIHNHKPLIILDDPFSALDRKTEETVFTNIKKAGKDSVILLISHRLYLFPKLDQIIWMNDGHAVVGNHESMMKEIPLYAELYRSQTGGEYHE